MSFLGPVAARAAPFLERAAVEIVKTGIEAGVEAATQGIRRLASKPGTATGANLNQRLMSHLKGASPFGRAGFPGARARPNPSQGPSAPPSYADAWRRAHSGSGEGFDQEPRDDRSALDDLPSVAFGEDASGEPSEAGRARGAAEPTATETQRAAEAELRGELDGVLKRELRGLSPRDHKAVVDGLVERLRGLALTGDPKPGDVEHALDEVVSKVVKLNGERVREQAFAAFEKYSTIIRQLAQAAKKSYRDSAIL